MVEALNSSETSVVTRATRRNIAEDPILRSHCLRDLYFINVFWDFAPCGCSWNRRFGGSYRLHHQDNETLDVSREACSLYELGRFKNLVTLKMEMICYSETSVLTRATRCKVPKDISDTAMKTSQQTVSFDPTNKKQTPWPLVRKRTIPTERPPLVDEI
jgi:hypothetical protein